MGALHVNLRIISAAKKVGWGQGGSIDLMLRVWYYMHRGSEVLNDPGSCYFRFRSLFFFFCHGCRCGQGLLRLITVVCDMEFLYKRAKGWYNM